MRRRFPLVLLLALLLCPGASAARDRPGDYDFLVLSLSWSPSFCARTRHESEQCSDDDAGRGLVVHGLWPQYERGWPQFCVAEPVRLPPRLVRSMLDIMPDAGLVRHQWRKHGSCTGLAPAAYFDLTREAFRRLRIPPAFVEGGAAMSAQAAEGAFSDANPGLRSDAMAIACAAGLLTEIRICLTRSLGFRACAEIDRRGCRERSLDVPAAD